MDLWVCEGIGLSEGQSKSERLKIQKEKVLAKGGRNFVLPTKGGNQEALCLQLDFVPLWLAKISITPTMEQETPELAARLMKYQLKAKDVLAAAFVPTAGGYTKFSKELQAIFMLDNRTVQHEQRIAALADTLEDPKAEDPFRRAELRAALERALADLSGEQRHALYCRYWLEVPADSRAHNAALRALRHPSKSRALRELL